LTQSQQDDLGLASLDFLGNPDELDANADQAMAELGLTEGSGTPEGSDPTNTIMVSTDRKGRIRSVEISRQWRDRLDPGDFGQAVFQAYSSANIKALVADAGSDVDGGGDSFEPLPDPERGHAEWLAQIRDRLDRVDNSLYESERKLSQGRGPAMDRTVKSPSGFVTLQLNGDALVGVTADIMLIRRVDAEQLRLELMDAFRDAGLLAER
jgi:hypothetical protein